MPHHTIVVKTEWEIGTHYRLDFPRQNQTEVIMTFFIGVDLHKTQFTIHVRTEEGAETLDQIRQYPATPDGYTEFLARIGGYKAAGSAVKIGVESTGNTRFFKSQAEKAGAEVTVINTLKLKVINESAKKTDRHDASTISEFLSKDMLPESYLCGKKTENIRHLLKSRERLTPTTEIVLLISTPSFRYKLAYSMPFFTSLKNKERLVRSTVGQKKKFTPCW